MHEPEGYTFVTRHQCLVRDTGHHGILFGGIMLQWLDEAGAMFADDVTGAPKLLTKALDSMSFINPVRVAETVRFYAKVSKRGISSVTIHVKAFVDDHRRPSAQPRPITEVSLTFVAVDDRGNKTPISWKNAP